MCVSLDIHQPRCISYRHIWVHLMCCRQDSKTLFVCQWNVYYAVLLRNELEVRISSSVLRCCILLLMFMWSIRSLYLWTDTYTVALTSIVTVMTDIINFANLCNNVQYHIAGSMFHCSIYARFYYKRASILYIVLYLYVNFLSRSPIYLGLCAV